MSFVKMASLDVKMMQLHYPLKEGFTKCFDIKYTASKCTLKLPLAILLLTQPTSRQPGVLSCGHKCLVYSWSSNFAVNVLDEDFANIEYANLTLLVKLGNHRCSNLL